MLQAFFRLLSNLPLSWIHFIGSMVGRLIFLLSPGYASRMEENMRLCGCARNEAELRAMLRRASAEAGKGLLELIPVWFRGGGEAAALITCPDWAIAEAARAKGRGVIFLTPHMGCFEISARHCARFMPITVLYRRPKLAWIEPLMREGRKFATLAPADLSGVRKLLRALKNGEAVGLLPDQAPGAGEGEWADFFGRPAYTMTLAGKLQKATGAAVLMAFAERLPGGLGYTLHLEALGDDAITPETLNRHIENMVKKSPEQYLWSYNRYKVPAGARPKEPTSC